MKKGKSKNQTQRSVDTGLFVILAAGGFLLLALLVALLVGSGIVSSGRARLGNMTNLASLGAVEAYMSGDESLTPVERADRAITRASLIMAGNKIPGAAATATHGEIGLAPGIGLESPAAGGTLRLGAWYQSAPLDGGDPCTGNYPCFIETPPPASWTAPFPVVNAIRLETKTAEPILAPLANLFTNSNEGVDLGSSATAAVVPRCTVFLMDASMSTTNDSHPSIISKSLQDTDADPTTPLVLADDIYVPSVGFPFRVAGDPPCLQSPGTFKYAPPWKYICPRNLRLFAYNAWISYSDIDDILPLDLRDPNLSTSGYPTHPCEISNRYIYGADHTAISQEGSIWCSMQWENIKSTPEISPIPVRRQTIYPNGASGDVALCYEHEQTPYGIMMIDKCVEPQPLASFLLGFNAGLRLLQQQQTSADRVRMSVFRGLADTTPYPAATSPQLFTLNPTVLIQLTNVDFRGVIAAPYVFGNSPSYEAGKQKVEPNFVSQGWFPFLKRGTAPGNEVEDGTNLTAAIDAAITALGNPAQCPSHAQKSIIVATDGVMTCAPGSPTCANDFDLYQAAERYLLWGSDGTDSVVARLRSKKIALTVLFAGQDVRPNVVDRQSNGEFVSYQEAVALGFRGLTDLGGGQFSGDPIANDQLIVDSRAYCIGQPMDRCPGGTEDLQNRYAFENISGANGVYFQRPNGVLAYLAIESGGIFCPLLSRGTAAQYEEDPMDPSAPHRLRADQRQVGGMRFISSTYQTSGEIAADCVRQTLGGNSFLLVEEEN